MRRIKEALSDLQVRALLAQGANRNHVLHLMDYHALIYAVQSMVNTSERLRMLSEATDLPEHDKDILAAVADILDIRLHIAFDEDATELMKNCKSLDSVLGTE